MCISACIIYKFCPLLTQILALPLGGGAAISMATISDNEFGCLISCSLSHHHVIGFVIWFIAV